MRRNLVLSGRRGFQIALLDLWKVVINQETHTYNYRSPLLHNALAGNILLGAVLLAHRFEKSCVFWNIRVGDVRAEHADRKYCQTQHFMIFHDFASSAAMGPTMPQLQLFIITFPGSIVPAKRCAVIASMSGRRGFQTARLEFAQNRDQPKNHRCSYRPSFLQNNTGW